MKKEGMGERNAWKEGRDTWDANATRQIKSLDVLLGEVARHFLGRNEGRKRGRKVTKKERRKDGRTERKREGKTSESHGDGS
jgi:hypothetical protein